MIPWETYITVTYGLLVFNDMCVGKHASAVIYVRGEMQFTEKHISLKYRICKNPT